MRKALGLVGVMLLFAGPVLAADLGKPVYKAAPPPPPVFSWTGWYIGGNAGFGWGGNTSTTAFSNYGFVNDNGPFPTDLKPKGFIGGGQIGYDWQTTNWVFGLVADLQGADINDSLTNITPNATKSLSEKLDFLGTARARFGWAANNWLIYGTGGFAYGGVHSATSVTETFAGGEAVAASKSETRAGWAAGGGINYAVTPSWILGVEYLHYDLGHTSLSATAPSGDFLTVDQKVSGNIVRGMISYKF